MPTASAGPRTNRPASSACARATRRGPWARACSRSAAMAFARAVPSRGKKPTKRNAPPPPRPLAESAARTALGPGIGTTRTLRRDGRAHERVSGIAHAGRARVGHERDALAGREALDDARDVALRRVRVERQAAACPRCRAREQLLRVARVLGGDRVDLAQRLDRAERDVLQVADGRRDDEQQLRPTRRRRRSLRARSRGGAA